MTLNENEESISEVIDTLESLIRAETQLKKLDFSISCDNIIHNKIVCDALRLRQVLLNILSNSAKYTNKGGRFSLVVREKPVLRSGFAEYEFTVCDTGIGMSEEFLKTIYDPFSRANSTTLSGVQGTGLGMAIVKNIVDMMGGTISISSEEGVGTKTTISLCFKFEGDEENAALTANAFEEDRCLSLEAGMSDFVAKPIDIENMKSVILKYI